MICLDFCFEILSAKNAICSVRVCGRESQRERKIHMDAIFDLWEKMSALYLPTKNQITIEQAPRTQIKSHSNPNLAGEANKRKMERQT